MRFVACRAGEKLRLSEHGVIISARLGITGSKGLDVTQKLHNMILKGCSTITPDSFDWNELHEQAGQRPPPLHIGVLRVIVLRAQGLIAADRTSSIQ